MPRVAFVLFMIALVPGSRAETLDAVLNSMIEAYGGEVVLRGAARMVQEWDLVAIMGNRHGMDRRSIHIPGRLKVELIYPGKTEFRVLNGEAGTVYFGASGPRPAADPQRDAMRLQLMRLYSPLALRDRIEQLDIAKSGEYWILTLNEFGLRADYFVNPANFHIEKVVGRMSIGGSEMTFTTEYSDFGFEDGVLVNRRENKFAGNTHTAVLRLRTIRFGVDFADAEFEAITGMREEDATIAGN